MRQKVLFLWLYDCCHLNFALDNHPPKVIDGVWQGTLAGNVGIGSTSTLDKIFAYFRTYSGVWIMIKRACNIEYLHNMR